MLRPLFRLSLPVQSKARRKDVVVSAPPRYDLPNIDTGNRVGVGGPPRVVSTVLET